MLRLSVLVALFSVIAMSQIGPTAVPLPPGVLPATDMFKESTMKYFLLMPKRYTISMQLVDRPHGSDPPSIVMLPSLGGSSSPHDLSNEIYNVTVDNLVIVKLSYINGTNVSNPLDHAYQILKPIEIYFRDIRAQIATPFGLTASDPRHYEDKTGVPIGVKYGSSNSNAPDSFVIMGTFHLLEINAQVEQQRQIFERANTIWKRLGFREYHYTYQSAPSLYGTRSDDVIINIDRGVVESVLDGRTKHAVSLDLNMYKNIDQVFVDAERAVVMQRPGSAYYTVKYDSEFGYPTVIQYDDITWMPSFGSSSVSGNEPPAYFYSELSRHLVAKVDDPPYALIIIICVLVVAVIALVSVFVIVLIRRNRFKRKQAELDRARAATATAPPIPFERTTTGKGKTLAQYRTEREREASGMRKNEGTEGFDNEMMQI